MKCADNVEMTSFFMLNIIQIFKIKKEHAVEQSDLVKDVIIILVNFNSSAGLLPKE